MNFTNENIIWIITIVVVLQILKLVYHGHYLWKMRKKKLKFDRELKQLKSALLPTQVKPRILVKQTG